MTWIKLDDNAVDHPKVESLSDRAFRWWVKGLSYASRFLTDGLLPPVFWKKVPKSDRAELTTNHLWDWNDPNFEIHDYLLHQTRKEDVEADKERNREKSKAYRDRRKAERRSDALPTVTGNATGNVTVTRDRRVTDPDTENREQIQRTDTEHRTTTPSSVRGVAQLINGLQFEKLQQTHAFVGPALRVPNALHRELLGKSGNRDSELRAWYAALDADLEASGKGTGDVFEWLRPRHQAFALAQGWVDAAPKTNGKPALRTPEEIKRSMGLV